MLAGLDGFFELLWHVVRGVRGQLLRFRDRPGIPSPPGVRINSAPNALSIIRRSTDIVSGIVSVSRYPLAAHTNASAMPVLPLVGSTTCIPGLRRPDFSASQIIAAPMRHFTLYEGGIAAFDLRQDRHTVCLPIRLMRTSGVRRWFPRCHEIGMSGILGSTSVCRVESRVERTAVRFPVPDYSTPSARRR